MTVSRETNSVSAKQAQTLLVHGKAPSGLSVRGTLAPFETVRRLPDRLTADCLDLTVCKYLDALPRDLRVRRLVLANNPVAERLLNGVSVYELNLKGSPIRELPPDVRVAFKLDLE